VSRAPFRTLFLGLLLVTVSACGDDPLGPEVEALASARARWESTGYTDYSYLYRLSCFCPPQLLEKARVRVSDGQITDVYLVHSDSPAPPDSYSFYHTIDGLFDRLAESLASDPVIFEVRYDGAAGYPTSAQVDISEQIADEEYSFTASDVAPTSP
jgi:hypothetical protein